MRRSTSAAAAAIEPVVMISSTSTTAVSYTHLDVYKRQQLNGYAEKDPTADIEGHDACRKICILADLAFGDKFDPDQVSCEGISKVTLEDVANADKLGCVIKLIGRTVRNEDGTAYAYVCLLYTSRCV